MAHREDLEKGKRHNVAEPLLRVKIGPRNECENGVESNVMVFLSTFVAVCGSFEFGSCVGYTAPTQFGIMNDLNLSYTQFGFFGSILNIGAMLGAVTAGRIADFLGRKGAMRLSSFVCTAGWITIYFALGAFSIDFGRFLLGYGIGVLSYVVPVYIAEITPKTLRGSLATANQLFIVIGIAISFLVGALITWQNLALTGIIPCVVLFIGLMFIPESPRWLEMVGCHDDFNLALRKLRGPHADISKEANEIEVGVGLMVFQQFVGINGVIFYAGQIFVSAGASPNLGSILYSSLQVVATVLGATMLIDRAGRRPLLLISATGLLVGNILIGTSFILKAHNMLIEFVPILAIGGVLVYICSFSIGMGAIPWVIMSEIFPINLKGIAGGLVTLVNWTGSWVVSFTFSYLMDWSSYGTFYLYAGVCALAIVFIVKLVPETKGRTLEEIQLMLD